MWKCKNCDTKNEDKDQFCACCGEKRQDYPATDPQHTPDSHDDLNDHQYQVARTIMQNAKTETELRLAIQRLEIVNSYKDAEDLIKVCKERIDRLKTEEDNYNRNITKNKESKKKGLKCISGICFLLAGIIISFFVLIHDQLVGTGQIKISFIASLYKFFLFDRSQYTYRNSIIGFYGGIICCILFVLAFLLIILGLLTEKRLPVELGSIVSILTCLELPTQYLCRIEYRIFLGRTGGVPPSFTWIKYPVLVFFYLFLILYFVSLLLCSIRKRQCRIFGWVGFGMAFAKLIPSGLMTWLTITGGLKNNMHFGLSVWAIVLSALLAIGSACTGYLFSSSERKGS